MNRPTKKRGDNVRPKIAPAPSTQPWWQVVMPCSITLSSGKIKFSRVFKNIQADSSVEACDIAPRLLSNVQSLVEAPRAWLRASEAVMKTGIAFQDSQWPQ